MEDRLKHWVDTQRSEFDIYEVDMDASWEGISQKLDRKPPVKKQKNLWWSVAASVSLILLVGAGVIYSRYDRVDEMEALFSNNEELADARDYYTNEISYKMTVARELVSDQSIFEDIDELDKAFNELKEDLQDHADNEEVVVAMIENYQLKLKILNRILMELKEEDGKRFKDNENI